jgi:hypothetical protein
MGGFARDAPKAQNGFILRKNCFVRSGTTTQFSETANHFSGVAPQLEAARQFRIRCTSGLCTAVVTVPPCALHTHFTFFC